MQLTFKDDYSPLLKLAIPLVLTGIMQSSVSFIGTIFLARLGTHALAAGALVAWLFWTVITILFGIFSAVNVLVSFKHGAKDVDGISMVLRDGLVLALLLAIPTFILLWNMAPLFLVFGQSPELVTLAATYLHALTWGIVPKFIMIVLFELLIGLGHARVITIFTMSAIPLYIFFSFVLIFGKFGFPDLGIAGAGWGMAIGDWLATFALIAYILCTKSYHVYLKSIFNFTKPSYLKEIIEIGLPIGLMYSVEVGFFFAVTLAMGLISVSALAANQVAMQYMGTAMGTIFCISQAVTTRMGHEFGASKLEPAKRACYAGIRIVFFYMLALAVIYFTVPHLLISIDFNLNDPKHRETVHFAKQFIYVAAIFQIFEAIRIVLFGALRSLKDTKYTLAISILSFWCIALPLGYLFAIPLHCGGVAFWWSMTLGAACSATLLHRRFRVKTSGSPIIATN